MRRDEERFVFLAMPSRSVTTLRSVSKEEAAAKQAALQSVAPAFTWRPPAADPLKEPSAADYLLHEACAAAKLYRKGGSRAVGPDLRRCML